MMSRFQGQILNPPCEEDGGGAEVMRVKEAISPEQRSVLSWHASE